MKTLKRTLALVLCVLMLMPMMTAWINAATISGGLDGETSRTVKTLYPGVTRTNIKTSSSSKYQTQNFNIVEFDPKQADLYVDVTNEKTYANNTQSTLNTVTAFNANNGQGKTAIAAVNGDLWMMSSAHSRVEGSGTSYGDYSDAVVTKALTLPRGFNVYDGEIITSAHMPQETPFEGEFWSFGMTEDHVPMIGCPELEINIFNATKSAKVEADGLNRLPANDALVVYSDKGCLNNYALSDAYEVVIDVPSDYTVKHGASITGTVTGIYSSSTSTNPEMKANRIILTARGTKTMYLNAFSVGDSVTLDFSVTERYDRNTEGWQNVQNAVGGHAPFVVDGVKWEISIGNNYPATIIGIKNDGNVVFITDDYGTAGTRSGLDSEDYWDFADDMDLNTAFILDGGGSTTLVELTDAGYAVTNAPTDGSARSVVNSVILSAGPTDTDRGTYDVKYPSEDIDLTNINFATDDGFKLLTNFSETKVEKTINGAKLMVSDLLQGPSVTISFGLPNTASNNTNSTLGSNYQKVSAGHTGDEPACFLVLDMLVSSKYEGDVQYQYVWVTTGNKKAPDAASIYINDLTTGSTGVPVKNNDGYSKYSIGTGIQFEGTMNTVRLQYLLKQEISTIQDGDYVILRSARLFSYNQLDEALDYIGNTSAPSMQNVTLNPNGGVCEQTKKYAVQNESYGSFPVPEREGYEFTGWYTKADGGVKVTADTTVTQSGTRTLYAHWEKKAPVVTFLPDNGSSAVQSYPILAGQTYESAIEAVRGIGMPDIPTKDGYTFMGWYCEEKGYMLNLSDAFNGEEELTFKAVWKRGGNYTCTASTLNIRSGPDSTYSSLGYMSQNDIFIADGQVEGKWLHGSYGDITGWASLNYLVPGGYEYHNLPGIANEHTYAKLAILHVDLQGGVFNVDSGAASGAVSANGIGLGGTETEFDIYVYHATSTPTDTHLNDFYFGTIWVNGQRVSNAYYYLGDLLNVILKSCSVDGISTDTLSFIDMKDFVSEELTGTEKWMDKDLLNGSTYDVTVACSNYTLTLDPAGGTMPENYKTSYVFVGGSQKFVDVIGGYPVPVRDGYIFKGWRWLEHSSMCWENSWGTQPYTFGKNITVTALWEKDPSLGPKAELREDENGKHIYVDGEMMTDGLWEVDGDYYYAYRDGSLASDVKLYTYNNNTDLVSSYRYFAEDCKMDKDGWLALDDDSGRTYYFNSAFHAKGANRIDGSYYFFMQNSGEMVRNETMFISAGNAAGLEAGVYSFGADGKMTTAPVAAQATAQAASSQPSESVSGLDNYVQSTEVLAVNTAQPVSLPEAEDDDGDGSDDN